MDRTRFLETLGVFAARICHDLVGPVGAIANGTELLADPAMRDDPEVVALIAGSSLSASRRLQYFRTAFGSGNALASGQALAGARALAVAYFTDGKQRLAWPSPTRELEAHADRGTARLLLALLLVAAETLPRGGTLVVDAAAAAAGGLSISIVAEGPQARLPDSLREMLDGPGPLDLPPPGPREAPAWLARLVLAEAGGSLDVDEQVSAVALSLRLPSPA